MHCITKSLQWAAAKSWTGKWAAREKEACGTSVLPAIGTLCLFTIFTSHNASSPPRHHLPEHSPIVNTAHPNVAPRCPYYKKAEGPFIQGKGILTHIGIPTSLNTELLTRSDPGPSSKVGISYHLSEKGGFIAKATQLALPIPGPGKFTTNFNVSPWKLHTSTCCTTSCKLTTSH